MTHAAAATNLSVANLFSFEDDIVVITGGATGLGEIAAQAFVQNGSRVIIASRKEKELESTCNRLNQLGPGRCEYVVADLKDKAGCDRLCHEVKRRTDRVTVLINNSGTAWTGPYDDFPESGWDKVYALNLKAVFYVTAGLHECLVHGATADKPSRVINISSVAGIMTNDITATLGDELGTPGHGVYSYGPTKAACIHLSKIQASKLMPLHVTVNCICPGVFPSRLTESRIRDSRDHILRSQPSGRYGKPADFAGLVLSIASAGGAHMTGNVFELDGGSMRSGYSADSSKARM